MNSFKSKTALITGAAGDIGAATAAAFAKAGANIVLTDRRADALGAVADAVCITPIRTVAGQPQSHPERRYECTHI
jgi:NADP-dependent 3-hydroxy acid dehydrogenase YdfG